MFRSLPTLKSEAYEQAATELSLLAGADVQHLLRYIGSSTGVSFDTLSGLTTDIDQLSDIIDNLLRRGYLVVKSGKFLKGGRVVTIELYRVNWKQIRQLNKAISLL